MRPARVLGFTLSALLGLTAGAPAQVAYFPPGQGPPGWVPAGPPVLVGFVQAPSPMPAPQTPRRTVQEALWRPSVPPPTDLRAPASRSVPRGLVAPRDVIPQGTWSLQGPAGPYTFQAPQPVSIRVDPQGITFTWAEEGPPEPPPDDPPIVPVPAAQRVAWVTLVYDKQAMTPGGAMVRSSKDIKASLEAQGIKWLLIERGTTLADGRSYLDVTGLGEALTGIKLPAIVRQTADGAIVKPIRSIPPTVEGAEAMIREYLGRNP